MDTGTRASRARIGERVNRRFTKVPWIFEHGYDPRYDEPETASPVIISGRRVCSRASARLRELVYVCH